MKRLIALGLVILCVFAFAACSSSKERIWVWTQSVNQEDIRSVTPWRQDGEFTVLEPLDDAQIRELVTLLNKLTKDSFTENKKLTGGTPVYGIEIVVDSVTYNLDDAIGSHGSLEIDDNEKMWWIDDETLSAFVQKVTDITPAE